MSWPAPPKEAYGTGQDLYIASLFNSNAPGKPYDGNSTSGTSSSPLSAVPIIGSASMAYNVSTRTPPSALKTAQGTPYGWADLPPCPIRGFVLDERGLIDLEQSGTPATTSGWPWGKGKSASADYVMSREEVHELAKECAKYESATRAVKDRRLDDTLQTGQERVAAELGFYISVLTSSLLFFFAARYYPSAYPRSSVIFKRFINKKKGYSEEEMQSIARRYRRPLMATTPMMLMFTGLGSMVGGLAILFKPGDVHPGETTAKAEIEAAKEASGKAREGALYAWNVYYHHPVYAKE